MISYKIKNPEELEKALLDLQNALIKIKTLSNSTHISVFYTRNSIHIDDYSDLENPLFKIVAQLPF